MEEFEKTSKVHDGGKEEAVSDVLPLTAAEIVAYKPRVVNREWFVSETDLAWLTIGTYVLGTGGGGSPYQHMLKLRENMRNGGVVRVISPFDLKDDAVVACGGGKGSPQVSIEKLYGDECVLHTE